jgi:hypothetical protein
MIKFNAAPDFDFDEWSTLYKLDPKAFEARRKALLSIEVARGGSKSALAKVTLDRVEEMMQGRSDLERAQIAFVAMIEATQDLSEHLGALGLPLARQAMRGGQTQRTEPPSP